MLDKLNENSTIVVQIEFGPQEGAGRSSKHAHKTVGGYIMEVITMITRTIKLTLALACLVAPCARGMQMSQGQIEAEVERLFEAIRASSQCENGSRQADGIKHDFARGFYLLGPLAAQPISDDVRTRLDQALPAGAEHSWHDASHQPWAHHDYRTNEPILEIIYRGAPWLLEYALDMIDQHIRSHGTIARQEDPSHLVIRNMNMDRWTLPIRNEKGQPASAASLTSAYLGKITLLHIATLELRPAMVELLITRGADINPIGFHINANERLDFYGITPLHHLAKRSMKPGSGLDPEYLGWDCWASKRSSLRSDEERARQLRIADLLAQAGAHDIGGVRVRRGWHNRALQIADLPLFKKLIEYPSLRQSALTIMRDLVEEYSGPKHEYDLIRTCRQGDNFFHPRYSGLHDADISKQEQDAFDRAAPLGEKICTLLEHATAEEINRVQPSPLISIAFQPIRFENISLLLDLDAEHKLNINATTETPDGEELTVLDIITRHSTVGIAGCVTNPCLTQPIIDRLVELGALTGEELRQQQAEDPAPGAAPGDPAVDGQDQ